MKSHNDEKFVSVAGSAREEKFENKKNDSFVEESNTGHDQNPAYKMPLSAKNSEFVGGVQTSAAAEKQAQIEASREEKNASRKHKVVQDKFASDPGKNLPSR